MLTLETISDRDIWNDTLRTLPYAHVLQTWEWGQFKYETTGWIPHRWAFKREGEIVALASVGARSIGGLMNLMYAPKGPALKYDDADLTRAVLQQLKRQARKRRAIWLKVDPDIADATGIPGEEEDTPVATGQAVREILQDEGFRFSEDQIQFRNTLTIDLTQSEDDILMAMSGNTRRKVRQAYKKDVTIRAGSLADLDLLYRLYSTTGNRNEFLVRPQAYYDKLWQTFIAQDLAHVLIAEYEGEAIAHVILFHFGNTCWYFYGASSNRERKRMPTYALQWEAMKWAKAQGYQTYDMWGAPDRFSEDDPMWGVYMFKQGFRGTVERRLGAWDYAPLPLLYRAYTEIYPRVIAWRKRSRTQTDHE